MPLPADNDQVQGQQQQIGQLAWYHRVFGVRIRFLLADREGSRMIASPFLGH